MVKIWFPAIFEDSRGRQVYVNNWQLIGFTSCIFCIGSYLISFLSVSLSKPITDSTVNMPIGVSYDISSCTGLGTMLDWNGRYKLMAGVRTGAGAPNTLLPEGPDPCRGPQYLGVWDTMCEADARGGVQTLLTVHTSINGKETFLCENYKLMRSKIRLHDY